MEKQQNGLEHRVNYLGGKNEIQMGGLQKEKVGGLGWEELGVQRC